MRRLFVLLALAAAAAPLAWQGSARPGADGVAVAAPAPPGAATSQPASENALELQPRALPPQRSDLFATPAPSKPAPVAVLPQAPKAPALPYKYDGSGEVQGKRFVYLAREEKSSLVHAGDTLDGTYAVESVARDHAVLRYLPLGIRQVLMYQAGAEPPAEFAAEPAPSRALALQVDMPAEVIVGREFVIEVALPGGSALKATVEVSYDAEVLSIVNAERRRPGRAIVEVAGAGTPRAQLRFKVLAEWPTSTDIDLRAIAIDASGKPVLVSVPAAHTVSLVLPGGA